MSPHEVMGPSFQMSFAATAALIGGYSAWSDWRAGKPGAGFRQGGIVRLAARRTAIFFIGLAATSIIAGLATTIYGVYHFSRVSPYGLYANLLAMPLVSLTVMPMVVLSALLMPFGLEGLPLDLMGWGIDRMIAVAMWFSERSPIDAVGTIPPASLVVTTLALLAATLLSTRLRLVSLPLVLVGAGLMMERQLPDALISEDGRLVALHTADGALAVNRTRPNGFTFDNWTMALAATGKRNPAKAPQPERDTFVCEDDLCIARHVSGALVVFAPDAAAAKGYCGSAALIVIDDATARNVCADAKTAVVTKRDTARKGSAAVYFADPEVAPNEPEAAEPISAGTGGGVPATARTAGSPASMTVQPQLVRSTAVRPLIRFSIAEPYRPWHDHRRYSREARGLPPYRREKDDD
jgi:competence protein ComEC